VVRQIGLPIYGELIKPPNILILFLLFKELNRVVALKWENTFLYYCSIAKNDFFMG